MLIFKNLCCGVSHLQGYLFQDLCEVKKDLQGAGLEVGQLRHERVLLQDAGATR